MRTHGKHADHEQKNDEQPTTPERPPAPTMGRIVHVAHYTNGARDLLAPAIVRTSFGDTYSVSLTIFGPSVAPTQATDVPMLDETSAPRDGWAWFWPPRQP